MDTSSIVSGGGVGGSIIQQVAAIPKGRGRPRASFAQTGEFDLSLIREYSSRPSLYDRNSKRFKDKQFTAQQWQIISHKLGYDVALLKDRMLQLRNRYNIEKRRLEQLREDANDDTIESPWPLFGSMSFLSDHIRSRRSYKHINPKGENMTGGELDNSDENDEADASSVMADVKVEMESETDFDIDAEQQLPAAAVLQLPTNNLNSTSPDLKVIRSTRIAERMAAAAAANNISNSNGAGGPMTIVPSSITIRRINGRHSIADTSSTMNKSPTQQQQQQQQTGQEHQQQRNASMSNRSSIISNNNNKERINSNGSNNSMSATDDDDFIGGGISVTAAVNRTMPPPTKKQCFSQPQQLPPKLPQQQQPQPQQHSTTTIYTPPPPHMLVMDKYRAFGEFVGSSLSDLPAQSALRLVEKFTTELVQSLMVKHENQDSPGVVDKATPTNNTTATNTASGVGIGFMQNGSVGGRDSQ